MTKTFSQIIMKTHKDLKHCLEKRHKKCQIYVITQHEVILLLRQKLCWILIPIKGTRLLGKTAADEIRTHELTLPFVPGVYIMQKKYGEAGGWPIEGKLKI